MVSKTHKAAQRKAAGKKGRTEVKRGRKRIDAISKSGTKVAEVERSGTNKNLEKAARRLKAVRSKQKVLIVPEKDMNKASKAMRKIGVNGTVRNIKGTKRRSI